jgi:tRNA threonylcarbamoyladenosine biosynthesis protein TsaB
MRALAIDTSSRRAGVVLLDEGRVVAAEQSDDPRTHAERLLGLIDRAWATTGWSKRDIGLVASGIGPGSFTGVRVALATAKGIALALEVPIVGVTSLEAMAAAAWEGEAARHPGVDVVVALLDAKKGEIFWGAYGPAGTILAPPAHVAARHLPEALAPFSGRALVVGEVAAELDLGSVAVARGPALDLPDTGVLGRVATARFAARGPDDLDRLEPLYVRPPDITVGC